MGSPRKGHPSYLQEGCGFPSSAVSSPASDVRTSTSSPAGKGCRGKPHSTSTKPQPAFLAVSASIQVSPTSTSSLDRDARGAPRGGGGPRGRACGWAGCRRRGSRGRSGRGRGRPRIDARERLPLVAEERQGIARRPERASISSTPGYGWVASRQTCAVVLQVGAPAPRRPAPAGSSPPSARSTSSRAPSPTMVTTCSRASGGRPSSARIRLMAVVMSRRESISVPSRSKTRAAGRVAGAAAQTSTNSASTRCGRMPGLVAAVEQELHGLRGRRRRSRASSR